MKKINTLIILFVFGIAITSCNSPTNHSTTHVKELVQSDVFEVLPDKTHEILVYHNAEEIEGEYLELAKVEIQEISDDNSTEKIIEKLKKETKELGGNGILLVENVTNKESGMTMRKMEAIAVYVLDLMPKDHQLVKL